MLYQLQLRYQTPFVLKVVPGGHDQSKRVWNILRRRKQEEERVKKKAYLLEIKLFFIVI